MQVNILAQFIRSHSHDVFSLISSRNDPVAATTGFRAEPITPAYTPMVSLSMGGFLVYNKCFLDC